METDSPGSRSCSTRSFLTGVTLLPFATRMSGGFYLACAVVLDAIYLGYARSHPYPL